MKFKIESYTITGNGSFFSLKIDSGDIRKVWAPEEYGQIASIVKYNQGKSLPEFALLNDSRAMDDRERKTMFRSGYFVPVVMTVRYEDLISADRDYIEFSNAHVLSNFKRVIVNEDDIPMQVSLFVTDAEEFLFDKFVQPELYPDMIVDSYFKFYDNVLPIDWALKIKDRSNFARTLESSIVWLINKEHNLKFYLHGGVTDTESHSIFTSDLRKLARLVSQLPEENNKLFGSGNKDVDDYIQMSKNILEAMSNILLETGITPKEYIAFLRDNDEKFSTIWSESKGATEVKQLELFLLTYR